MTEASIIDFDFIEARRAELGKIVCTSGGFDPIHPGHLSCFLESKRYGDTLIVLVNDDDFLMRKKGFAFQDSETRCRIVSYARGVDFVLPFAADEDTSACTVLRRVRPHVFTKGGDRNAPENIPEWDVCQELHIDVKTNVGEAKRWSSSWFTTKPVPVQRPWGSYTILEKGYNFKVKRLVIAPGASLSLQMHHQRDEHWTIVRGIAGVSLGERGLTLTINQSLFIPNKTKHRLVNLGAEPLEIIEVQVGSYLGEDDIVRFADDYGRVNI